MFMNTTVQKWERIILFVFPDFLRVLSVVEISPEWVTNPEQVKSGGGIALCSLWTGVFWGGVSSIVDETVVYFCESVFIVSLWWPRTDWDECRVTEAAALGITTQYTGKESYRAFWMPQTGTGQQVFQNQVS